MTSWRRKCVFVYSIGQSMPRQNAANWQAPLLWTWKGNHPLFSWRYSNNELNSSGVLHPMNIERTSGKGGSSEAALGPGRERGGFPRILPFSMAGADLPAFLGFRGGALGFAPIPVTADGCACSGSWPLDISIGVVDVAGSIALTGSSSKDDGAAPPVTFSEGTSDWDCKIGSPAGLSRFRLGAAGGSINRSWVNAGMARSGSSAARTSSSE